MESADATEQRRRQRIDAAARMLNHLVAVVVWIGVTIAVFHLFDIDAAFFLSSAGFIGAGVAIGGQHKVNDYLTGLSVLFEDRYGVGDELVVDAGGGDARAVVDNIGLVTTRLRDDAARCTSPTPSSTVVRNLSQEAAAATVRLQRAGRRRRRRRVRRPRCAAWPAPSSSPTSCSSATWRPGATADGARRRRGADRLRPLDDRSRSVLVERAEEALGVPRRSQS